MSNDSLAVLALTAKGDVRAIKTFFLHKPELMTSDQVAKLLDSAEESLISLAHRIRDISIALDGELK